MKTAMAVQQEACGISQTVFRFQKPATLTAFHVARQALPTEQRRHYSRRRNIHSTSSKDASLPFPPSIRPLVSMSEPSLTSKPQKKSPLSILPLSQILRTYFITSISSSPAFLRVSTNLLRRMLESKNPLLRIETNPVLRAILWETFYKQFCAGSSADEIAKMCNELRAQGFGGVILEYALEVLKDADTDEAQDIADWRKGILASVEMAAPGDFVGLKWSGMGPAAMRRMKNMQPPSKAMDEAMHAVCQAAVEKDVALLPSAEETWNLEGYHSWSLGLQKKYNLGGKCILYNTYQAYLKQAPGILAEHLALAKEEGFTFGAKLVRGAYLGSEKRDLIWPSIEATHAVYDGITAALIKRRYNNILQPTSGKHEDFPGLKVVLATHNAATVAKAQALRQEQIAAGEERTPLAYAQLQGMADEVSCSLIAAVKTDDGRVTEKVVKCTSCGTMTECLNYLLRRAAENKDAAGRTNDTRIAMQSELVRRMKALVGLA